jgi:hypothetical protein
MVIDIVSYYQSHKGAIDEKCGALAQQRQLHPVLKAKKRDQNRARARPFR